jgi:hypothetical protein
MHSADEACAIAFISKHEIISNVIAVTCFTGNSAYKILNYFGGETTSNLLIKLYETVWYEMVFFKIGKSRRELPRAANGYFAKSA